MLVRKGDSYKGSEKCRNSIIFYVDFETMTPIGSRYDTSFKACQGLDKEFLETVYSVPVKTEIQVLCLDFSRITVKFQR